MIRRSATATGAYLLRRAVQLASGIVAKFGRRTEVIDGYIVRGQRTDKLRVATVLDTPALLGVLGYYRSPPFGAATSPTRTLVVELAAGRDSYLGGALTAVTPAAQGRLLYAGNRPRKLLGSISPTSFFYRVSGERGQPAIGLGAARGHTIVYTPTLRTVNPLAYVSPSTPVVFALDLVAPSMYVVVVPQDTPTAEQAPAQVPFRADQGLSVTDSIMWNAYGARAMCKPASPSYPSEPYETAFHIAQAPWYAFTPPLRTETGYRVWLVAHAVYEMVGDDDKFGARGLWLALVDVAFDSDLGTSVADLVNQFAVDSRTNAGLAAPQLSDATGLHRYNAHLRVTPCTLADGTMVLADPYLTEGAGGNVRYSLDIYWATAVGLTKQALVTASDVGIAGRMAAPIGMDVDENDVVVLVAFSAARLIQTEITIVRIESGVASIVLQGFRPVHPCLAGYADSKYSAGFLAENLDPGGFGSYKTGWQYVGAGGNQVRYIGNGKWVFYVSSALTSTTGATRGDWALATYDQATNDVTLTGVINSTQVTQNQFDFGAIDCVRRETEDRPATLIATRGGNAQYAGHGDVSSGQTYISYDSGQTWTRMLDVGSPAGTFHCGSVLQPRTQPISRI